MKYWIVFLFALALPLLTLAQEEKISMRFEESLVPVKPGETFKNTLVISNKTNQTVTLKKDIQAADNALLKIPAELVLAAHEVRKIPVKYIANDALIINGTEIAYKFSLNAGGTVNQQRVAFSLDIADDKSVWIIRGQDVIYLKPGKQEQEFSFVLENASYSARQLELEIEATPSGLDFPGLVPVFELKGKERKWMNLKIVQQKDNGVSPDYQIQIRLKDRLTGTIITSSRFSASTLTHTQQLFSSQLGYTVDNFAELTYNQTGPGFQYTQLRGGADFAIGNAAGKFSTTLEYYNQQQGLNIYDTWLDMQVGKVGMRIGNLSGENIDFNLSGRGAKASYKINDQSKVEVVGVENSFQFYSNVYKPYETGKTIAASYFLNNKVIEKGRISVLHSKDPMIGDDIKMASFESAFVLDSSSNLRVQGGLSDGVWENPGDPDLGYGLGAVYSMERMGWRFYSDNYYSTANYAGNRRGNFYLNQRLSRSLSEKSSFYLAYINSKNKPRYFNSRIPVSYPATEYPGDIWMNQSNFSSHEQSLGMGFSSRTANLAYTIEPKVEDQTQNALVRASMLSYRLGINLSRSWAAHSLSLQTDLSRSNDKNNDTWFYGLRGNLGYYWKGLGLQGMFQVNPYYISDLQRVNQNERYWTVAVRPGYTFNIKELGIKGRMSLGADYVSTSHMWMKYMESHLDYNLGNTWDLTGDLRLMDLSSSGSMIGNVYNTQFRIGLRKRFGRRTAPGNHKVQMEFYNDLNNNQVRDEEEQLVNNLVVKLDKHVSMTDENGRVKYMNVPKGDYELSITSDAEWRIAAESGLRVDENVKINVPLIKVVGIQGTLTEIRNKYDRFEADVQGIQVYARSQAGLESSTITDEKGDFYFNLAPGLYTFFIRNNRYEFLKPSQNLTVLSNDGSAQQLRFEFRKKNTDIKVQRF